jgi:alpha-beta hydrolase superfamily lysophospholipase
MDRALPLYFGAQGLANDDDARPLFGWLHSAPAPARLGLVICNPFGYEAICTHRVLRHFAQAAAAAGIPALRFDYDGTGDSAGHDREPHRLEAWVASVGAAADALRAHADVDRVVLLGLRLGALLAALAAARRDDVEGLVAIAPVLAGKAHVRELRALQMTATARPVPAGVVDDEGVQAALGFALTAETKAALGGIDLLREPRPPAPAVLLLERDDLPADETWPRHLASLGVAVERRRLPGYVEMMLGAEHSQVPGEMLRATLAWLEARRARLGDGEARPGSQPERVTRARLGAIVETAERVDAAGRLFGILSTPAAPPATRRGLLLLNAGAIHRIGPSRLYVALARRWAERGHAVLRLDVSGIGDSAPAEGRPENVVYTDDASDDVRAGLTFLRRQPGVTEVHALGLCSGGYNAFKAAVAGVPLDGVLLINPLTFFYKADQPLAEAEDKVIYEGSRYLRRLRDRDAWLKLVRRGVDVRVALRTVGRFVTGQVRGRAHELARRAGLAVGDDLARELTTITGRRIPLRFVFSAGDPGFALLHTHGGATVEKLRRAGRLTIEVIEGADHTFTPLWSHPVLTTMLAAHFDGPPGAAA